MIVNQIENIQPLLQKWVDGMVSFPNNAEADALLENQLDNLLEMEDRWKTNNSNDI